MIDYETFCKIRDYQQQRGLKAQQIARELGLDGRTVARWIDEPRYHPKQSTPRISKLDPYKARIRQWLESQTVIRNLQIHFERSSNRAM